MKVTTEQLTGLAGDPAYTVTRSVGRAAYGEGGGQIEADERHSLEYGGRGGTATVYVHYPAADSPENQAECLRQLREAAAQSLPDEAL